MIKFKLLIIIIFSFTEIIKACSCAPPGNLEVERKDQLDASDIVLIGEVINMTADGRNYLVVVVEVFKGNITQHDTLQFIYTTYCEPVVEEPDIWLIYANQTEEFYEIIPCGLSRSINKPEQNQYFNILPAPPPDSNISSFEWENFIRNKKNENKINAIRELEIELEALRANR